MFNGHISMKYISERVKSLTLELWDFSKRPPAVEIILDQRIFERWFRITPYDALIVFKCFPDKLDKNCFGHVTLSDLTI